MQTVLKEMIPTNTQLELGTIGAAVGTVIGFLCGWDDALTALLALMAIDYVTGVLTAFIDPTRLPRSKRGFLGICKKVMMLAIVALAHFVSDLIGNEAARTLVVWFFVGNEGLSILENAANAGVPVPKKFKGILMQLRQEKEERTGENGREAQ